MVHQPLDAVNLARILANQRWRKKVGHRGGTFGIRHHVILAAGRKLAASADAGIGFDDNDRGLRHPDHIACTPSIGTADIGQVGPVYRDAGYFHGQTTMLPVCALAMKAACASRSSANG